MHIFSYFSSHSLASTPDKQFDLELFEKFFSTSSVQKEGKFTSDLSFVNFTDNGKSKNGHGDARSGNYIEKSEIKNRKDFNKLKPIEINLAPLSKCKDYTISGRIRNKSNGFIAYEKGQPNESSKTALSIHTKIATIQGINL